MLIYHKQTRFPEEWPAKAPVPPTHTTIAPPVGDDVNWHNGAWITGLVPVPEKTRADFDAVATAKSDAIQAEKVRVCDGGFIHNGVLYDSDTNARLAYQELESEIAKDATYSTPWKASKGVWVNITKELYEAMRETGKAARLAAFTWQAQRDVLVAAVVAEVEAGTKTPDEGIEALDGIILSFNASGVQ